MTPIRIETISGFKIAGIRTITTLAKLNPAETWKVFMPLVKHLQPFMADANLYAIQKYRVPEGSRSIDPKQPFDFWAAVHLKKDPNELPDEMENCTLEEGLYAVFLHKGPAHTIQKTMAAIINTWLPGSGYEMDARHHLQVMAPDYKGPKHPDAEEEVWIPVKKSL